MNQLVIELLEDLILDAAEAVGMSDAELDSRRLTVDDALDMVTPATVRAVRRHCDAHGEVDVSLN